ncbi:MAG: hypothetical protein RLY14_2042 [Planctomycetota bacterium]|jgi:ComF family protein
MANDPRSTDDQEKSWKAEASSPLVSSEIDPLHPLLVGNNDSNCSSENSRSLTDEPINQAVITGEVLRTEDSDCYRATRAYFSLPLRMLRGIAIDLLDLTLPPKCVACQNQLPTSDALICQHCYSQLGLIHHGCLRCGAPLPAVVPETAGCLRCHGRRWSFSRAVALGPYSGLLQQLVIGMKQPYHETTTMYFGKLLAERVRECGLSEEIDLVMPVPSHWLRRLTRKISTAEVLAESIALTLKLPWSKKYAWRSRATRKQGTLRASERGENVKAAFRAKLPKRWQGASILLVDDVLTSGATASEVAKSLLEAGAGDVIVASVARALGEHKMSLSAGESNR